MTFRTPFRISIFHQNVPNMIGKISQAIADNEVNINNLTNRSHNDIAYTLIDLDGVNEEKCEAILKTIEENSEVIRTRIIKNPYL